MGTESTQPAKLTIQCPGCHKKLRVAASMQGKRVKCPGCAMVLAIGGAAGTKPPVSPPPVAAAASNPDRARAQPAPNASETQNCMVCQCPIESPEELHPCPSCSSVSHYDCWQYNQGCAAYGCSEAPPTEGLDSLEIPPSHWGQEDKQCPSCNQTIKAAAVRCRHCGATFETANPQTREDFHSQESDKSNLPMVKAVSIAMIVCGLMPCTAPFVAIGGPIWYISNRKSIALLPGFHSALAKIGVGASILMTICLIAFTVLHFLFPS